MSKKTQRRNMAIVIVAIALSGSFGGLLLFGDSSGVVTGNISSLAFIENHRALNCEAFNQLAVTYTSGGKSVIGTAGREGFNPLVSDQLSFTANGRDVDKFHVQLILNCQGDLMEDSNAIAVDGFTNFRLCGDPSNSGTKCFVGNDRTFTSSSSGALATQTSASVSFSQKAIFDEQSVIIQEFDFSDNEIEAVFPVGTTGIHFKSEMLPVLNIRFSHPQFGNIVSTYDARASNDLIVAQYGGFANPFGDSDGDGILDNVDGCVGVAEDNNGFEDSDGCPDAFKLLDTDGDGILDGNDSCVTQAETVNGFEDEDGCPDTTLVTDTDGDGIDDALDQCPNDVETINGFQDADGCPDSNPTLLDTDGDGVADVDDGCPNESGSSEFGGCPEVDTDGDGLNDFSDDCPNEFGIESFDGCPDPSAPATDSDNDGIIDSDDLCPNTASGDTVDADGCQLTQNTIVDPVAGVDSDGDGILDVDDVCIFDVGTFERNGCPANPFDELVDIITPDTEVDPIDPLFDPTIPTPPVTTTPTTPAPQTSVSGEITDNDITILIIIGIGVAMVIVVGLSVTKKIKI